MMPRYRWAQVLVLGAVVLWGGEFVADRWVWSKLGHFSDVPHTSGRPPRHDPMTVCQASKDGLVQVLLHDGMVYTCLPESELPPLFRTMGR